MNLSSAMYSILRIQQHSDGTECAQSLIVSCLTINIITEKKPFECSRCGFMSSITVANYHCSILFSLLYLHIHCVEIHLNAHNGDSSDQWSWLIA